MESLVRHLETKRARILDRLRLVESETAISAIRTELDHLDEYLQILRK